MNSPNPSQTSAAAADVKQEHFMPSPMLASSFLFCIFIGNKEVERQLANTQLQTYKHRCVYVTDYLKYSTLIYIEKKKKIYEREGRWSNG